jgi:hypothetical protein
VNGVQLLLIIFGGITVSAVAHRRGAQPGLVVVLAAAASFTVVVTAFSVSINTALDKRHQYPGAYRARLQEEAVWPVVDFLLETFVFAYIGLQLRFVVQNRVSTPDRSGQPHARIVA